MAESGQLQPIVYHHQAAGIILIADIMVHEFLKLYGYMQKIRATGVQSFQPPYCCHWKEKHSAELLTTYLFPCDKPRKAEP